MGHSVQNAEGKEIYETAIEVPPSLSAAVEIDSSRHLFDLYLSIPKDQDHQMHEYFMEITLQGDTGTQYYDLLGPYSIKGADSVLLSQQFQYDSSVAERTDTIILSVMKDGVVAQQISQNLEKS